MKNRGKNKLVFAAIATLLSTLIPLTSWAEQKIIKEETISFDKCLEVIKTSENKLSIAPKITDLSGEKRIAVFTLSDGSLAITCDGAKSKIIVSTNTD